MKTISENRFKLTKDQIIEVIKNSHQEIFYVQTLETEESIVRSSIYDAPFYPYKPQREFFLNLKISVHNIEFSFKEQSLKINDVKISI